MTHAPKIRWQLEMTSINVSQLLNFVLVAITYVPISTTYSSHWLLICFITNVEMNTESSIQRKATKTCTNLSSMHNEEAQNTTPCSITSRDSCRIQRWQKVPYDLFVSPFLANVGRYTH